MGDTKANIERVEPPKWRIMSTKEIDSARKIWLTFVGNGRNWGQHSTQQIQVIYHAYLQEYMDRYAYGIGQSRKYLRFFSPDGVRLEADKTAEDYGLEEGDQIDVFEWQIGGND